MFLGASKLTSIKQRVEAVGRQNGATLAVLEIQDVASLKKLKEKIDNIVKDAEISNLQERSSAGRRGAAGQSWAAV